MKTQVPITSILGTQARDFTSYVGWLVLQNNDFFRTERNYLSATGGFKEMTHIAHTILTTHNITESVFVRGEEPKPENYVKEYKANVPIIGIEYKKDHKAWQNHQPLFKGEFEKDEAGERVMITNINSCYHFWMDEIVNLNDFLLQCQKLEVKGLEYNDKYMIEI